MAKYLSMLSMLSGKFDRNPCRPIAYIGKGRVLCALICCPGIDTLRTRSVCPDIVRADVSGWSWGSFSIFVQ